MSRAASSTPLQLADPSVGRTWWCYAAGVVTAALCLTLSACSSSETLGPEPLSVAELLGEYELVSYGGQPLPTGNGRATYYGGEIVLEQKQRYTETLDVESCYPASPCTRDTSTSGGTWLLLHDGTLYFDPHEGYGWPPPSYRGGMDRKSAFTFPVPIPARSALRIGASNRSLHFFSAGPNVFLVCTDKFTSPLA